MAADDDLAVPVEEVARAVREAAIGAAKGKPALPGPSPLTEPFNDMFSTSRISLPASNWNQVADVIGLPVTTIVPASNLCSVVPYEMPP